MSCQTYREALTKTIAADGLLSMDLRSHLNACDACRAFYEEERQLFAAIDSGLQSTVNAEVPPSLLLRVRVGLNGQKLQQRSWVPTMAFAVAAGALVLVVFLRIEQRRPNTNLQTSAAALGGAPVISGPASASAPQRIGKMPPRRATVRSAVARSSQPSEVAVLIPSGRKQAFDKLLAGLENGAVQANLMVVEKSGETAEQHAQQTISPLAIAPLEIKPLAPAGDEAQSVNESSNP